MSWKIGFVSEVHGRCGRWVDDAERHRRRGWAGEL